MKPLFMFFTIVVLASALWSSGIIPAIVPAAVPAGNKQGSTGSKFQIATGSTPTAGNCPTWDSSQNLIDSGINTCGGSGTSVNSVNGLTGAVNITDQNLIFSDNTTNNVSTTQHGFAPKLPNSGTVFLNGLGTYTTPGIAASTGFGAIASRPAAGSTGNIYIPSDSYYSILRDNGSTWDYQGFDGQKVTPPVTGSFSAINSPTVSAQTNGAVVVSCAAGAGDNIRSYVESAPGTPYTRIVRMLPTITPNNFATVGAIFRESGTGKIEVIGISFNSNAALFIGKYTNATTFSATALSTAWEVTPPARYMTFKMADDGVNLTYSYSQDGVNFSQLFQETRGTFFTTAPNQIGVFCNANNASFGDSITFVSID